MQSVNELLRLFMRQARLERAMKQRSGAQIAEERKVGGVRQHFAPHPLQTLEIRLYANCHIASWHASERELAQIRQYLSAVFPHEGSHEPRPRGVAVSR
jgi:hypothetical protein